MGQVDSFRHIAEVLRSTQRAAIELENAPDQRKRLRSFSLQETASLLGITLKELRAIRAPQGRVVPATGRLSFDEVQTARRSLAAEGPGGAHDVARRPEQGEALAVVAFTNFKGGSAKTTSSVHFAQYLA